MGILKDDLKNAGYSQEEAYFHKQNRELIEKIKEKERKRAHLKLVVDNTGGSKRRNVVRRDSKGAGSDPSGSSEAA